MGNITEKSRGVFIDDLFFILFLGETYKQNVDTKYQSVKMIKPLYLCLLFFVFPKMLDFRQSKGTYQIQIGKRGYNPVPLKKIYFFYSFL